LLERSGDSSGFDYYLGCLKKGYTRVDVVRALYQSSEAKKNRSSTKGACDSVRSKPVHPPARDRADGATRDFSASSEQV